METIPPQPNEESLLAQAFSLIDPAGSLVAGTEDYDTIRLMLQGWIREYGSTRALCMARLGAKHLDGWRKFL
ncbi:MAG: hypothetical protein QNI89_13110 [Desulfobacterales bacterium]|nr:hypothetical protein [Desulfobacterales bacterium]MDJ0855416.1 hypothetical protein [Desulfobacterales bacterium]MDJ0888241.1 hypothetical protein [Desulfobacterales bacterium]